MTETDPNLNEIMDLLNLELQKASEVFTNVAHGVSAEVELSDSRLLGHGKVGGEWMFYVRTEGAPEIPLLKLSRKIRIEAAGKLRKLLVAALENDREQLLAAREALGAVRVFNSIKHGVTDA